MAQREGCLLIKLQHGVVGMPDRLLVRPWRTDVFVEFKRPGEKLTKIQKYWFEVLGKMGKRAEVVQSLYGFQQVLTS